jgi:hypothetical protein
LIFAEGVIRQASIFGENLVLKRRVTLGVHSDVIRVADTVENEGFRPSQHAIQYHINFGYPFLDEGVQVAGDFAADFVAAFNAEDKRPTDDFRDYYQEAPLVFNHPTAKVVVKNRRLLGGTRAEVSFDRSQLPQFGIWRAFQSGVYAFGLEPALPFDPHGQLGAVATTLQAGDIRRYEIAVAIGADTEY